MFQTEIKGFEQLFRTFRSLNIVLDSEARGEDALQRRLNAARRSEARLIQSQRAEQHLLRLTRVELQTARFRGIRDNAYTEALLAVGVHETNLAVIAAQMALVRNAIEQIGATSPPQPQARELEARTTNHHRRRQTFSWRAVSAMSPPADIEPFRR